MKRLVVIGNGMVGHRLVEAVHELDTGRAWQITVLGDEPGPAYDRVALSSLFHGAVDTDLHLPAAGLYEDDSRVLHTGDEAASVDVRTRVVRTSSGHELPYDELVFATGSVPFVPPVQGRELPGVFVYRTVADVAAIRAYAAGRRSGVVVGGGLLGLEAAGALRELGLHVRIVEFADRLMSVQVDAGGGEALRALVTAAGYAVELDTAATRLRADEHGAVAEVVAERAGESLTFGAELVVFAAGVRPRDQLAAAAGLTIGPRGGVVIDQLCRTSDPAVSAVGECACLDGAVYGLVAPGYAMAETVAARLVTGTDRPVGAPGPIDNAETARHRGRQLRRCACQRARCPVGRLLRPDRRGLQAPGRL